MFPQVKVKSCDPTQVREKKVLGENGLALWVMSKNLI